MSRANTSTLDGLVVGYGTRDSINPQDSNVHTLGRIKQAEIVVDYTNIAEFVEDVLPAEGGAKAFVIPAGSNIVRTTIVVEDDVTTLTSLAMGLKDTVDGGQLHSGDDVLVTDVEAIEANLETGDTVVGLGSLMDALGVVTSADATLSVTVTGSAPLAGRMIVLIEYIEPQATQTPPAVIVGEI